MHLAIFSDIHGNLTSFEAVLEDLDQQQIDQIVCLGDVAAFGPQPRECLARLQQLNCPVVMGNTDDFLLDPVLSPEDDPEELVASVELWGARQLLPEDRDYLATFQPVVTTDLGDGLSLLAFHGSPRSNREIILAITPEEELETIFSGAEAQILAGGHTHTPLVRRYKDAILLNPGSVGLPHEIVRRTGQVRNPPWAEYAVISTGDGDFQVNLRRIPVDISAIHHAILESGMPYAGQLAADWR